MKENYLFRPVQLYVLIIAFFVMIAPSHTQAASFTVTSVGDAADSNTADNVCQTATAGECTLRAAIEQANQTAGADEIKFNIAGAGVKTITPLAAFPDITQTVTIDGYTQPGASPNTLAVGSDAVLLIEINGGSQNTDLFHLFADNNVIRGLVLNGAPFDGIQLDTANGGNVIEGNFIGTDATGTIARGNGRFGVSLFFLPSANNRIGGTTPAARNVISGNGQGGVVIGDTNSTGNVIENNYIGTNAAGTAALPNGFRGVFVGSGAANNLIGGATDASHNVISGNDGTGIELGGSGLTNNDVRGNYIGIAADGATSLGNNGFGIGVGGTATGNTILSNRIFANQNIGINLDANGVTLNDAQDADTGANSLQNFPVIASAVRNGGVTTIQGTLNSTPNTAGFTIEFFVSSACDASGSGEGQRFLGSTTVSTDNAGNASFNQTFAAMVITGESVTTTATDPNGDTSEFSACATVTGTAQTFAVTTTADAGAGSLRQAILDANANALAIDTISFNIAGAGVQSIAPLSALPDIADPVILDGYTQPGASVNTSATTDNAVILIELNGANVPAGADANGLRIVGSGSTVRGLAINRFARDGISLNGGDNNTISGNFIGTDPTGMIDLGNGSIGIEGEFGSNPNGNIIGGTTPAARNIISGNGGSGIEFNFASGNVIQGNFIGLAADGATAMGNSGVGVGVGAFTSGTLIGGDDAADGTVDGTVAVRNYISANGSAGVFFGGAAFGGCTVAGNYIGTDTGGTRARGNGSGISTNIGNNSTIGGTTAGAGNLISGNTGAGINLGNTSNSVVRRNRVGTQADGASALGNGGDGVNIAAGGSGNQIGGTGASDGNVIAFNAEDGVQIDDVGFAPVNHSILGNSIYSNGGLGINLSIDGVTPNDAGDADAGANNLQNYPVITAAQPGSTRLIGTFNSTANTLFRLEFFNTPAADASGNGEGRAFIGAFDVMTDASGNATFDQTFAADSPLNSFVTATATNLTTNATSEFSNARQVLNPSAATVSIGGRVLNAVGRGVFGARVMMVDSGGNARYAVTNPSGHYHFIEVSAGETYILTATYKRSNYASQIVSINEESGNINFVVELNE